MAGSFVRNHTTGTSASGTAVTATLAAAVPAGNLLACWVAMDNTGTTTPTVSSIDKPGGETATWARVASHDSSTATAAGGVRGELWIIKTTVQWASGTVITATLSASPPKSHMLCAEHTGVLATLRGTAGTSTSATGAVSAATSGTALVAGDLVLGAATFETSTTPTADADTTNGSWSTALTGNTGGGASAAQVSSIMQYKYVTATGVQTFNPTAGSTDSGAAIAALQFDPTVIVAVAAIDGTVAMPAVTLAQNASATPATIAGTATIGTVVTGDVPYPRTIAGLVGWWDAIEQTGLANGAAATSVTDHSGQANTATEATNPPTYDLNQINGQPAFSFNGTTSRLGLSSMLDALNGAACVTVFAVARTSNVTLGTRQLVYFSVGGAASTRMGFGQRSDAVNEVQALLARRLDADASQTLLGTTPLAVGDAFVWCGELVYTDADAFLWHNQTAEASNTNFLTAGSASATDSQTAGLGWRSDTAADFWSGPIGAVLVYVTAARMTTANRQGMIDWLTARWFPAGAAPAAISGAVSMGAVAVTVGALAQPATITAVATLPAPSLAGGASVTPAVIAGAVSMAAPTITTGASVSPATIAAVATVGVPTVTTGAITRHNSYDGGPNGTALTPGNTGGASGDAYSSISSDAGGLIRFSNAHVRAGTFAMECAGPTVAGRERANWAISTTDPTVFSRVYAKVPTGNLPPGDAWLLEHRNAALVSTAGLILKSDGRIAAAANGSQVALGTVAIPLDTWVRLEMDVVVNATTGQVVVRWYNGESTTPGNTVTSGNVNTGSDTGMVEAGMCFVPAAAPSIWFDDHDFSTAAQPGPAGAGGANVTPATLTLTASIPAIVIGFSATRQPAVIAGSAAMAAPTVSAQQNITTTPATIVGRVAVGAVKRLVAAPGTSVTVAGLQPGSTYRVTVRAVDTSGNRSADSTVVLVTTLAAGMTQPATIAGAVGPLSAIVTVGALVQPATIAGTVAVATPAIRLDTFRQPATISGTAAIPTPGLGAGASRQPATIVGAASLPAPTVSGGVSATVTPATVAATTAMPAPTVATGGGATPATITGAAAMGAVAATVAGIRQPATIVAVAAVGAPSVVLDTFRQPATLVGVVSLPAPTVTVAAVSQPATVTGQVIVGTPLLTVASVRQPATIAGVAAIPTPSAGGGGGTLPGTILGAVVFAAPLVTFGMVRQVTTIVAVVSVGAAAPTVGGTRAPATIVAVATMVTPAIKLGATAQPAAIALVVVIPLPSVVGGIQGIAAPATIAGRATVGPAVIFVLAGIVPYWRGRITVLVGGPSRAAGGGPAHVIPAGPTGVRGG